MSSWQPSWYQITLQWRHNERDGVSNHRLLNRLLNRLFRCISKKISKSASLAFVGGINRWPVNSPNIGPVTQKLFSFDDVIMDTAIKRVTVTWQETTSTGIVAPAFTNRRRALLPAWAFCMHRMCLISLIDALLPVVLRWHYWRNLSESRSEIFFSGSVSKKIWFKMR